MATSEPLAVRLADRLLRTDGLHALGRAEAVRDAACHGGDIARADLFVAVCAVIAWRDRVRWIPREATEAGEWR